MTLFARSALASEGVPAHKVAAPAVVSYVVRENSDRAWHTIADWPQGVDIDFTLVGTLPEDLQKRDSLPYWLVAEPAEGLSFVEGSIRVYVVHANGTEDDVTDAFVIAGSDDEVFGGTDNIRAAVAGVRSDDQVRLAYRMRLNDAANIGLALGNDSYAHLEYGGTGFVTAQAASRVIPLVAAAEMPLVARGALLARSVSLKTTVYTYTLEAEKVDKDTGAPLADATFALRDDQGKWYRSATDQEQDPTDDDWVDDISQATVRATDADGMVRFEEVDSERYELVEVEAPTGYEKVDPVDVSISTDVSDDDTLVAVLGATSESGEVRYAEAADGIVRVCVKDERQASATPDGANANVTGGHGVSSAPLPKLLTRGGGLLSRTSDATLAVPLVALIGISVSLVACGVARRYGRRARDECG